MSRRFIPFLLLAAVGLAGGGHAQAEDAEARVQRILASPAVVDKARKAGKKAAFLCVHCHGEAGESVHAHIPNLAGQNPTYLLNQIEKFGDGRRQDEFMSGLIRVLKPEDRLNMAIYFAFQPVRPAAATDPALVSKGQQIYLRQCKGCHGEKGHGERHVARLAGQHALYLSQSLQRFRAGNGDRTDPVMTGVARQLNDADIAALATFLSSLD